MHAGLLAYALVVGGIVSPAQQSSSIGRPAATPLPVPKQGLSIKAGADGETKLEALLDDFSRVTEQHLLITPESRNLLERRSTGLNRSLEVPPEEVYFVVETILMSNDFVLTVQGQREPRLLSVHSLHMGSQRASLRNEALYVPAAEIESWARHPAILVTTIIDLPSTDVRTLSNSMRTMFTDANTQQIVPVGMTNSLILTGFAHQVANYVAMLQFAEEMARKAIEQGTPPPGTTEPVTK